MNPIAKHRAEVDFFRSHPGQAFDESRAVGVSVGDEQMVSVVMPFLFDPEARRRIVRLEHEVAKLPQFDCPLKHYFAEGLYVREIFIPAGTVLVGYVHMQDCVTTISRGCIVINDGGSPVRLTAPFTKAVPAGSKKAGYALEDTIWCDAYANPDNERNIEALERRLCADTHAEYLLRLEKA